MSDYDPVQHGGLAAPKRSNAVWWILGAIAGTAVLGCAGIIAFVAYLGLYAPETSVYTANRIPSRFMETINEVGALDEGEQILYFYSDALTDIRDGFSFVSDKRVVIYSQATGSSPLTAIQFEDIEEVLLYRDESFLEDSEITMTLEDGTVVSFPVSSEFDRDENFFKAIQERVKN